MKPAPPRSRPAATVGLLARVVVGLVLVYAGATKAAGPVEDFALVIRSYGLLPRDMTMSAAFMLPWVELLLGWSLLLGFQERAAGAAGAALFTTFLAGLGSAAARGLDLPNCGCFGEVVHLSTAQALLLDMTMLALCVVFLLAEASPLSLDAWAAKGRLGRADRL